MSDDKPKYEVFHEQSAIERRQMDPQKWVDSSEWPQAWTEIQLKSYPRLPKCELPLWQPEVSLSLRSAIDQRTSSRDSVSTPLPAGQVRYLLEGAMGVRSSLSEETRPFSRRRYPSAGARFTVECYLISLRCMGLPPGLYHWGIAESAATTLVEGEMSGEIRSLFGHQWIADARAVFVLTGVVRRASMKYGERAYRFALLEAGHIMQNLSLLATEAAIPLVPIGGFADNAMARFLDLLAGDELVLYAAALP